MIFHLCAGTCTGPIFTIFGMWRHTPDVLPVTVPNFKLIAPGVTELWGPKIGCFSLTFIIALTAVLCTTVLHCDNHSLMFMLLFHSVFKSELRSQDLRRLRSRLVFLHSFVIHITTEYLSIRLPVCNTL